LYSPWKSKPERVSHVERLAFFTKQTLKGSLNARTRSRQTRRCYSIRKLQVPFDRLEASVTAQQIDECVSFHVHHAGVRQSHGPGQQLQSLGRIAPRCVNRSALIRGVISECGPQFCQLALCIGMPSELFVRHCETPHARPVIRLCLARRERTSDHGIE